ncbi:integrase catalytic domain-containing protein, partial [Trichonephila inaurata madagascariensis]
VYRCVHLGLVTSISTECFIQVFRRFISHRGRPPIVYSNNGTNFVGASAGQKKVDWEKVVSQETLNPITWKFIPPTAAWWERLIRSVKSLIVRVLDQASVNYEKSYLLFSVTLQP